MLEFYKILEHTADLAIRVWGKDEKELFVNAARAFFDVITDINTIRCKKTLLVKVEGADLEECFFNWLDELLSLFDARGFVGREIEILNWQPFCLEARIKWEKYNPKHHPLKTAIKAITYHNLKVQKEGRLYVAEVLFDI